MRYAIGILREIALNLLIALGRMDILMVLILPIHEHSIWFNLFVSIQFLSSVSYNFLSTGLLPPWLGLFLGILFFFCSNCEWDRFLNFPFC